MRDCRTHLLTVAKRAPQQRSTTVHEGSLVPRTLTLEPSCRQGVAFFSSAPTQAFRPPDQPRWVAQRRRLRLWSPDSAQRMATVRRPRPGVPARACAQEAAGTIWRAHRLGGPRRSLTGSAVVSIAYSSALMPFRIPDTIFNIRALETAAPVVDGPGAHAHIGRVVHGSPYEVQIHRWREK